MSMPEFANYGLAQALSYKHDWNVDMQRLAQNGERIRQAKADNEAKVQFYAEKLKSPPLDNDFDRIQEEKRVVDIMKEVQQFEQNDPNWQSSLKGQLEFNQISNKIVNNDITLRNARVKGSYEQFRKDAMEKNLSVEDIAMYDRQYENYSKFGNINGPNDVGQVQEFSYQKPLNLDIPALIKTYANEGTTETWKRKGNIQYVEEALTPENAMTQAISLYSENVNEIDRQFKAKPLVVQNRYGNAQNWIYEQMLDASKVKISSPIQDQIRPQRQPSAGEIAQANSFYNSPFNKQFYIPATTGQTKGNMQYIEPLIKRSENKVYTDDLSYVNIGGLKLPFNGNKTRYEFNPVLPSDIKSKTTKGQTSAGDYEGKTTDYNYKGYDANPSLYEWNILEGVNGPSGFVFYDVNATIEDATKILSEARENLPNMSKQEADKYLEDMKVLRSNIEDAYSKGNKTVKITIGTPIEQTSQDAFDLNYFNYKSQPNPEGNAVNAGVNLQ
jgi:hypothetical protein